jgi:hypothetical protein
VELDLNRPKHPHPLTGRQSLKMPVDRLGEPDRVSHVFDFCVTQLSHPRDPLEVA